jgi:hypothetical protein
LFALTKAERDATPLRLWVLQFCTNAIDHFVGEYRTEYEHVSERVDIKLAQITAPADEDTREWEIRWAGEGIEIGCDLRFFEHHFIEPIWDCRVCVCRQRFEFALRSVEAARNNLHSTRLFQ